MHRGAACYVSGTRSSACTQLTALLGRQVAAAFADHRGQFGRVEPHHPAGHDGAVRAHEVHHVACHEVTRDAVHTRCEQRPAPVEHRGHGARVEVETAAHVGGVPQPEAARRHPPSRRSERRADGGPGRGRVERGTRRLGRREQHRHPRCGGHRRCGDLGGHTAAAQPAAGAGHGDGVEVRRRVHVAQQAGGRGAGIAVVEAVDVGEQHERVRADDVRHERGEAVVVAHPDLVGRHGVVLVHDGQHVEPEQALQRPLGVAVVGAADHVVGGEQHLADGLSVAGERARVGLGEQELADGRRGLLGGEVAGAAGQP